MDGREGNGCDAGEGRAVLRRRSVCERRQEVSSSLLALSLAVLRAPAEYGSRAREGTKMTYLLTVAIMCGSRRRGGLAEASEVVSAASRRGVLARARTDGSE